jgi:hypothetical protein
MQTKTPKIRFEQTKLLSWFERDRIHLNLVDKETEQETIFELWDDDARQAFEDGFLDNRNLHFSLFEYAQDLGFIK